MVTSPYSEKDYKTKSKMSPFSLHLAPALPEVNGFNYLSY